MKHFGSFATRTYNRKTGRVGHLFRGKYKWSLIDSPLYYAHAVKYVYRNPIKEGLAQKVEEYRFSTLHGILGESALPFPLFTTANEQFSINFIPQRTEELLAWLNTPYKSEDADLVRKALRRKIFQISGGASANTTKRLEFGLA